ncbi:YY1-associated factor 2-like [Syngnathoides biaculeatus]|uniref:YY1-associated factor 2-like n=1 Tax=Syngnathoides biaculeatus TaxID=300417 RepID=UPI002ADE75AD|nr:YY1-associated factor 2-like [Syngnathoides biaculeatus]
MGDKKSPTRPKRQAKQQPPTDDAYWDCSVCTFKNTAEAFKCTMCDVRKGTSTRKPRPVSQLVVQQVNQQFAPPATLLKKEKKEKSEKSDKELTLRKKSLKRMRPRLKNVDRSSAQHLEVTVGDLTVIITDFKERAKPTSTLASAAAADPHSQSGSSSDNTERGASRCSSPRGEGSSVNGDAH